MFGSSIDRWPVDYIFRIYGSEITAVSPVTILNECWYTMLIIVSRRIKNMDVLEALFREVSDDQPDHKPVASKMYIVQLNGMCFPFACLTTDLMKLIPGYGIVYSESSSPVATSTITNIAHVYNVPCDKFVVDSSNMLVPESTTDRWTLVTVITPGLVLTRTVTDSEPDNKMKIDDKNVLFTCVKFGIVSTKDELNTLTALTKEGVDELKGMQSRSFSAV